MKDVLSDSEKLQQGLCPGFSHRLNHFLDLAGYPTINMGRLTEFSEDIDITPGGARKWIAQDSPPKFNKLLDVCQTIIDKRLTGKYNARRIAGWLEYGEEVVPNPFEDGESITKDHLTLSAVYVAVHDVAKALDIDIYNIDSALMEGVYDQLMRGTRLAKSPKPDEKQIARLLTLADLENSQPN